MTRRHAIVQPAAVRAVMTPLRMEILETLEPDARLTVAEIGARLGRRAGSLYYHVRALVKAGVVIEAEQRLVGRRWESRYRLVRSPVKIGPDASTRAGTEAAVGAMRAMLRLTAREFEAALASGAVRRGRKGVAIGRRSKAHLTAAELDRVRRHLEAIDAVFSGARARSEGRLVTFTAVMLPLRSTASD